MPKRRLALSRRAIKEYRDITAFSVERFGKDVADSYMSGLDKATELLRDFPSMAPADPILGPETRILVHRSHRIFYRVEPDRVLIIRILHHAQATPPSL